MNSRSTSYFQTYPNPIPAENRKIKKRYVGPISKKNKEELMDVVVNEICEIFELHSREKGIVHVTSWEYQKNILEKLPKKYLKRIGCVIHDDGFFDSHSIKNTHYFKSVDKLLAFHKTSNEPTVILSPSCWYGIDLRDDLSRFQIIVKAPFIPMTPTVSKKMKQMLRDGNDWYETKAAFKLVQGCGRSVRSKTDYATTYLLDSNCEKLLKNRHIRPWFLDAVKN